MNNVLICTPCYDNMVTVEYMNSILDIHRYCTKQGYEVDIKTINLTSIAKSRDYLANCFMYFHKYTHLLFLDSDISIQSSSLMLMLGADKPFIGLLCPERRYRHSPNISSDALEQHFVLENSVGMPPTYYRSSTEEKDDYKKGIIETSALGCGATLLKREVFYALQSNYKNDIICDNDSLFKELGLASPVYQYFAPMRNNSTGAYMSEDLSFSHRWTSSGGKIHVLLNQMVKHVGKHTFKGAFNL